jgi:hypothetical protein
MNWVEIIWLLIGFLFGVTVLKTLFPRVYRFGLRLRFWFRHGRKGRFILLVYSDNPNWKDHIETKILPRIERHSVILNWSKRREWEPRMRFESKLFDHWAASREFSPTAVLFSVIGKVKIIRLCQPSENPKHGKERVSKQAEQALLSAAHQSSR